jgi:hypothetical protein
MLSEFVDELAGLQSQLTSGYEDQALNGVLGGVDFLNQRDGVGASLAGSVFGSGNDVLSFECDWDAVFLNW